MTDELVDIVDDNDMVIASVTRAEMRAKRLQHRSVGIVVLSSDGRLLIHRRSPDKDIWPGWWDIAAGGVVTAGETYEDAARRELAEELGVAGVEMEYLCQSHYVDDELN
ncbi:MAG: NUDIX domain-containing protein, partial [Ilumatobacteraceae bacterium]